MTDWVTNPPKVSIVIPFYNCPYIHRSIESALHQTYPNLEVLVVSDGSTQHLDKIAPYRQRIRLIEKQNGGTASALNAGIGQATGEYFCWLSSDDLYVPEKVQKQMALMQERGAHVCYSSFLYIDPQDRVLSGSVGTKFANMREFYETLSKWCPINGCTVMLRMNVFDVVGLFDTCLPFANDYEFWLRVCQKYEFHYLDEPLVQYRVHDAMGTKKYDRVIRKEIFIIQQKHRGKLMELMGREN